MKVQKFYSCGSTTGAVVSHRGITHSILIPRGVDPVYYCETVVGTDSMTIGDLAGAFVLVYCLAAILAASMLPAAFAATLGIGAASLALREGADLMGPVRSLKFNIRLSREVKQSIEDRQPETYQLETV